MNAALQTVATRTAEARGHCQHYWLIEMANGAKSKAVCRRCQSVRRFHNSIDDLASRDTLHSTQRPMRQFATRQKTATSL